MAHNWYAIQSFSGSEQAVKKGILSLRERLGVEDKIKDVVVPTEDVIEIKNGKKKITERSLYSGYVFAHLDLDTQLWHAIQTLPRVGGFIGEQKRPSQLSEKDINTILEKMTNRG
ncbi:MAG: transcription termination/antitermination protein NusG, partial [Chloroflexi bacterium]